MNVEVEITIGLISLMVVGYGLFRVFAPRRGDGVRFSSDKNSVYQIRKRVRRKEARRKDGAVAPWPTHHEPAARGLNEIQDDEPTAFIPCVGVIEQPIRPGYRAPAEPTFLDSSTRLELPIEESPTTPSGAMPAAHSATEFYDAERCSNSGDAHGGESCEPSRVRPYVHMTFPKRPPNVGETTESRPELQTA